MKMKMCETMIKGTRNVGNRLSGNSRNGDIEIQFRRPTRKASTDHEQNIEQTKRVPYEKESVAVEVSPEDKKEKRSGCDNAVTETGRSGERGFNSPRWARIKK